MGLTMIQEIVQLNNFGVSRLACGDSLNALKAFKSALVAMSQVTEECDMMKTGPVSSFPAVKIVGLEDAYFFAYDQALLLDASTDVIWANSCLFFNMALAFHQMGQLCCDAARLNKAIRMYDLAAKILVDASPSDNALAMAAWNNQASIYYALGDYAMACELLERVADGAEHLPELTEEKSGPMETRLLEEIYLNVVIVKPPTIAPSA
jgi:tetratricopeptide (TPR) repeat protein